MAKDERQLQLDLELLRERRRWRRRRGASPKASREPGERWRRAAPVLRWLGGVVALVAVAGSAVGGARWLQEPGALPLRHVRLQGELRYLAEEDLRAILEPRLGENFVTLDIGAIHRELADHPWVARVELRRRWPDTLQVVLEERRAFARWGEDEMVDVRGERFRPGWIPNPGRWARLDGPDGLEVGVMQRYISASRALRQVGLVLNGLHQDSRRAWVLELGNGIEVHLGRSQFDARLNRFAELYPRVLAPRAEGVATVDLRYANGFTVRWRSPGGRDTGSGTARAIPDGHGDRPLAG